jgi:hypothetical protein
MANYHTHASLSIPINDVVVTRLRLDAIDALISDGKALPTKLFPKHSKDDIVFDDCGVQFGCTVNPDKTVSFYHDETIDMEQAISVAVLLLDLDGNDDSFVAEWALVCSRPITGAFGGGAVAFNRHGAEWAHSGDAVRACTAQLALSAYPDRIDPQFPLHQWQLEVRDGNTRRGYADCVAAKGEEHRAEAAAKLKKPESTR